MASIPPVDSSIPQRAVNNFWSHLSIAGLNDCWEWQAYRARKGYGVCSSGVKGVLEYTHRFSWRIHFGPIPVGLHVLHICDNPPCCNPAHLWLGTNADNHQDKINKGHHKLGDKNRFRANPELTRGSNNPQSKLTESDIIAIRNEYANSSTTYAKLAQKFNTVPGNIGKIVTRQRWSHIT
jgi:hypothetical protein